MKLSDHSYLYTNKDGRTRLIYVDENGRHRSKSYPRILMEEKLGRPLDPSEDVHHIDGDKTNNSIDNLALVAHGEHQRLHNPPKYVDKIAICDVCGKEFIWTAKRQCNYQRDLNRHKRRGVTCCRHCSYILGKHEQVRSDSNAECELNGETFPNGNTVPNTDE